jgi:8-oxo-dGTP pyrophosphatase MutT (NUDIX family)
MDPKVDHGSAATVPVGASAPEAAACRPGEEIDSSWYRRPADVPVRAAAGGVVVRRSGSDLLVALSMERDRSDPVLPKGHVERGETVEAAARREIWEETGVADLVLLGPLGAKERLAHDKRQWKRTEYFLYATRQVEATPGESHRHLMAWFPLDHLPDLYWPEQRVLLAEHYRAIVEAMAAWEQAGEAERDPTAPPS